MDGFFSPLSSCLYPGYKLSEQVPTFFLWASSKLLNLLNCDLSRRISAENYQLRIPVLETLKWTAKWLTILVNFSSNLTLISQKSPINLGKKHQIDLNDDLSRLTNFVNSRKNHDVVFTLRDITVTQLISILKIES